LRAKDSSTNGGGVQNGKLANLNKIARALPGLAMEPREALAEADIATLAALADAQWASLPIIERLRLLLSRGSA
jgi:hypothetical protein